MDNRDHYITKFLVSNPPIMGKLASQGHQRPKKEEETKKMDNMEE